jgi:hypothetical protein
MHDYQLTQCRYDQSGGNPHDDHSNILVCEQISTSHSWDVTVKGAGTRVGNCAKSGRRASNRYAFSSCLRYISLGYRAKILVKSAVAASVSGVQL